MLIARRLHASNEIWAMDFVHDQLALGTKIRVLTIVGTFSRFAPAVEPRFRFRGADVVETLERVGYLYGLPKTIRVDQGTEFVSRDLDVWSLHTRRHDRLLAARQADGQRVHRNDSTASSGRSACRRTGS